MRYKQLCNYCSVKLYEAPKCMGAYKLSSELPSGLVHGPVPATTLTKHTDTLEAKITNTRSSSTSGSSSPALQLLHVELCSSSFRNLKLDLVTSPKSPCNISSLSLSLNHSHTHTRTRTHITGSSII